MAREANFFHLKLIPIYILEFIWVTFIYGTTAFIMAFLINGYLLPPYNLQDTDKTPTWRLYIEIIFQLALQSFLVVIIIFILQKLPSPIEHLGFYRNNSPEALAIRDPAILTVLLYTLSTSMQGRIIDFFSRFDKDTIPSLYSF